MGLIRPRAGHAFVLGQPVSHPEMYLPRVGALIESPAFYPALSGRRNLHALAILGRHDRARVDEVLTLVGLAERGDDAYGQYSLGMKQRLGIAAALLPDPELLILDEPTNGLDPAGIREMRTLLRAIGDSGRTVFVSSHLLAEIQRMCDRLLVLFGRASTDVPGASAGQLLSNLSPSLATLSTAAGLVQGLTIAGNFIGLISLVLFAQVIGGEYREGTLKVLLSHEPRRVHLLFGKLLALAGFVAVAV